MYLLLLAKISAGTAENGHPKILKRERYILEVLDCDTEISVPGLSFGHLLTFCRNSWRGTARHDEKRSARLPRKKGEEEGSGRHTQKRSRQLNPPARASSNCRGEEAPDCRRA